MRRLHELAASHRLLRKTNTMRGSAIGGRDVLAGAGGRRSRRNPIKTPLNLDFPSTIFVGNDVPVRDYSRRLVNPLKRSFALADGLDGETPKVG